MNKKKKKVANISKCYINGTIAALAEYPGGECVLLHNQKHIGFDDVSPLLLNKGYNLYSFSYAVWLFSADADGVHMLMPNAKIEFKGSKEFKMRQASASNAPETAAASGSSIIKEDTFVTPSVDSVSMLSTMLKILPAEVSVMVKTLGTIIGNAVISGSDVPDVPKSLEFFSVIPGFSSALDTYKDVVIKRAKEYVEELENKKKISSEEPITKRMSLDSGTSEAIKLKKDTNFYIKLLKGIQSSITKFNKKDINHYYSLWNGLYSARIEETDIDSYKYKINPPFIKEITDAYVALKQELSVFGYYEYIISYRQPEVSKMYNCTCFAKQIIEYYTILIANKNFKEIYSIDNILKNILHMGKPEGYFKILAGIPVFDSWQICIAYFMGEIIFCQKSSPESFIISDIDYVIEMFNEETIRNKHSFFHFCKPCPANKFAEFIDSEALLFLHT